MNNIYENEVREEIYICKAKTTHYAVYYIWDFKPFHLLKQDKALKVPMFPNQMNISTINIFMLEQ